MSLTDEERVRWLRKLDDIRDQLGQAVSNEGRHRCFGAAEVCLVELGALKSGENVGYISSLSWMQRRGKIPKGAEFYDEKISRLMSLTLQGFDASR